MNKRFSRSLFASFSLFLGFGLLMGINSESNKEVLADSPTTYEVSKTELVYNASYGWWNNDWTRVIDDSSVQGCIAGRASRGQALAFELTFPEAGTFMPYDGEVYIWTQSPTANPDVLALHNGVVVNTEAAPHPQAPALVYYNIDGFKVAKDDTFTLILDAEPETNPANNIQCKYAFKYKFVPDSTSSADYNDGNGITTTFADLWHTSGDSILKYYACSYSEYIPSVYYDINSLDLVFREVNNNPNVSNCWEGKSNWTLVMGPGDAIAGHSCKNEALDFEFTLPASGTVSNLGTWQSYVWAQGGAPVNPYIHVVHNDLDITYTSYPSPNAAELVYFDFNSFEGQQGDKVHFIIDADSNSDLGTNVSIKFVIGFILTVEGQAPVTYTVANTYYTTDTTNSSILKFKEVRYDNPLVFLNETIAAAGNVNTSLYTSTSVAAFTNALTTANQVAENAQATIAEIRSARVALEQAMNGLVAKGDKSVLSALYNANKDKASADYTTNTFAAFTTALQNAKIVLDNDDAIQSEIDEVKTALQNAIDGLVARGNKTELQTLYDANKDKAAADYTEETFSVFSEALNDAKTVLDNVDAIQSEINEAKTALQDAIDDLVEAPKGCGGSIIAASALVTCLAFAGVVLLKKKEN